jgi:hypothetical protein
MFRYRLQLEDGSDMGEASYVRMIQPADEIHIDGSARFRRPRRRRTRRGGRVAVRRAATGRGDSGFVVGLSPWSRQESSVRCPRLWSWLL